MGHACRVILQQQTMRRSAHRSPKTGESCSVRDAPAGSRQYTSAACTTSIHACGGRRAQAQSAWRQRTQAGQYREPIAEFNEAIRISPGFALAYNGRGFAWFHLRDYAAAIEDLTQAIRLNSNFANACRPVVNLC